MFEISDVTKRYGALRAVHNVTLSIQPGKTTVLIGPSGSGKSTVLRMMVGLVWPDEGAITFDQRPLHPATIESLRRRLGYVIQRGGLFPHLSASDNITLMARFLRWDPNKIDERLRTLTELTQFPGDGLSRYPRELSGGQQQRVSLMRALFLGPEVLLLDEPLGALDPMIRFDLQRDLKRIFAELRTTVVLVTHDLAEADYFGDRLVLMRDGGIVQTGTLREFRQQPVDDFVTRFVEAQRGLAS